MGSRMTSEASMPECSKPVLGCVMSLVPPARAKYSPHESVVGMQISGMLGWVMVDGGLGAPRA